MESVEPADRPAAYVDRPPTAGAVLGGVFWRSWLLTIVGGFAVGAVTNFGLMTQEQSASLGTAQAVGFLGLLTGVVIGWVAALIVAGLVSLWALPYPGAAATVRLTRWIATATIGAFVAVLTGFTFGGWAAVLSVASSSALAWWLSPWAVQWYVDRVESWRASIA